MAEPNSTTGANFPEQSLGRQQQVGYKPQAGFVGTAIVNALQDTLGLRILEAGFPEAKERPERVDKRTTLSLLERFDGKRGGTWSIGAYALPSGVATAPDIDEMIDAGGMRRTRVITYSGAGPFQVGERITGGTSGASAEVIAVYTGAAVVVDVFGSFTAAETLTGDKSGNTGTLTANSPSFAMDFSAPQTGTFVAGDTLSAPSGATAVVDMRISSTELSVSSVTGTFVVGETVTGAPSTATGVFSGISNRYTLDSALRPLLIVNDIESFGEFAFECIPNVIEWAWDGGDACKTTVEGIFARKATAGASLVDGAVGAGTSVVVDDASVFSVGSYIQFDDENNNGNGYLVSAVDESTNTLTISPTLAAAIQDNDPVGPIIPTLTTSGNLVDGNTGSVVLNGATYPTMSGNVRAEGTVTDNRDNFANQAVYSAVYFDNRRVTFSITMKMPKASQLPFFDSIRSTAQSVVITLGSTAGSIIKLTMPTAELNPVESIDIPEETAIAVTIAGVALGSAGDDELQVDYQ